MATIDKKNSEIWTIGGGKGGIGKSFIISSVGNYLAQKGKSVVLIDADLGGANLHTFLGVNKPKNSLTDFFDKKIPIAEIIADTGIPNMRLLIGAVRSFAPSNIKYTQKLKFFRHIGKINADYILIDVGAGAHFNTIDTFLIADKMIALIVPEIISVENMYFFLKNVFLRKLMTSMNDHGLKDIFISTWKNKEKYNIRNIYQFISYLKDLSNPIENIVDKELSNFMVYILLNQVRSNQEIMIGNSVKSICMKYFGLNSQYIGYVEHDDFISRCVNKRQPYMEAYPASRCAKEIERLTENLIKGRHINIKTLL
jgi:flagellar biosynthesis protein FlhG